MKQRLNIFPNLLLVVLCDYVLGAIKLLLDQQTHIALSNVTVSVSFQNYYDANNTLKNTSVLLMEASSNQIVAKKQLPENQRQGVIGFECSYFKNAGNYWLKLASENIGGLNSQQNGETLLLNVKWPIFDFDLRRTSGGHGNSLQLGLFTNELLCPINKTVISLDVILTSNLYELGTLISNETLGLRTRKSVSLFESQWVNLDCHVISPEAYITTLLKSAETGSIIASSGPIDLVRKFGYKLAISEEVLCESSVVASVISPPCTSSAGRIAVFKYNPLGQMVSKLYESILNPEDHQLELSCTLFDSGTNKYCFEFSSSNQVNSAPWAKECVLIQRNVGGSWSTWQAWSSCSATCGGGIRERFRECVMPSPVHMVQGCPGRQQETSPCSLEECPITTTGLLTPLSPEMEGERAANNLITITGISLCLSIIFATILITLWRKLCRTPKCSSPVNCDSPHSSGFRKNSDEEDICPDRRQQESFSEGEASCFSPGDTSDITLNFRRSLHLVPEDGGGLVHENLQSSAQKIIPPIYSYRLAQQQLKEMKKKGLKETTKLYHVAQNSLMDTMKTENQEVAAASKFRIKSPFPEQPPDYLKLSGDRPCSRMDSTFLQADSVWSPGHSSMRRSHHRYFDNKGESTERGYQKSSQFRRTASFHETRKAKPFRKRSMSTLTPSQPSFNHCRAKVWDHVMEKQHCVKSKNVAQNTTELELYHSIPLTTESLSWGGHIAHKQKLPEKTPDLVHNRPLGSFVSCVDNSEHKRTRSGRFLNPASTWRKESTFLTLKDDHQKAETLSPSQYRKSKCQSFPSDTGCHFYDNTSFALIDSEQQMYDLPGYFELNEGEISTLTAENLVI
ncbi:thrombospondin type-1 domain-containing protein 1 [Pantherophis guttatus]|uniref:Thrombospondin type-1 domain-containing protein 1 n=1 Tax=Pantherophis guttatus TaxID=94885 RepID=A0A6P9D996_PANGU|nr:thrombospondin type-1 domain-containing protein 1 [Pantherophis guttatus]XP_034288125.1 thrombospondin type-1 domain-containing protein 1 [Pantherophis guttatus]